MVHNFPIKSRANALYLMHEMPGFKLQKFYEIIAYILYAIQKMLVF